MNNKLVKAILTGFKHIFLIIAYDNFKPNV